MTFQIKVKVLTSCFGLQRFDRISYVFLVLNVLLITCTELEQPYYNQVPIPQNIKPSLKICANSELGKQTTLKIPAFSAPANFLTYNLMEFKVDEKMLDKCQNGDAPIHVPDGVITRADLEGALLEGAHIELILRLVPYLHVNGYLSVGNHQTQTAEYFAPLEFCINQIAGTGDSSTAHLKICPRSSSRRPVLRKCCLMGMLLNGSVNCMENPNTNVKWDPSYMDAKTWKLLPVEQVNPIITSPILDCENRDFWDVDDCNVEFHPVTDNTVAFLGAYRTWEFLNVSTEWCIETMKDAESGLEKMALIHCVDNSTETRRVTFSAIYLITMYIGAGFHLLTTLVYLVTWPKQNIHGKTLCSCTASLLLMNLFLGTAHLLGILQNAAKGALCFGNGVGGHYFMIAAFTWLLVLNFDLWRTFRSMRTHSGNNSRRFVVYSMIGWIFPLLVTGISIALDLTYVCRNSRVPVPEYGVHHCFVTPWAQGYYVYYLLGVLIGSCYIFAGLTLFALYNFKKDTANVRSNRSKQDQQNVLLFLKLTVVMGLTWVFEVISWAATRENENNIIWFILDMYNILSAILIFIIFVCKKATLNMLEQSVPMLKGVTAALSKLTFSRGEASSDNTNSTVTGGIRSKKSVDDHEQIPMMQAGNASDK